MIRSLLNKIMLLVACFAVAGLAVCSEWLMAADLVQALPPSVAGDDPAFTIDSAMAPSGTWAAPELRPIPDVNFSDPWTWQILPEGLIYKSYLAGGREPRLSGEWSGVDDGNSVWDITLGGRAGILRYGTQNPLWPEGWQLDIEGAAFPRLTLDSQRDLVAVDFRFGVPLTHRLGPWETKVAYYHLSSHLGDEYMLKHPGLHRINYARDVFVAGAGWRPHSDWRFYGEVGYAVYVSDGAKPWEFQLGAEFSPARPTGFRGAPFVAVNSRLRQEVDFGGSLTVETGWQWRGPTGHLFRFGFRYFNGLSEEFQFHRLFEEQYSLGMWYDF